jgi:hypothetical protein
MRPFALSLFEIASKFENALRTLTPGDLNSPPSALVIEDDDQSISSK